MQIEKGGRVYDLAATLKLNSIWWHGYMRGSGKSWAHVLPSMESAVKQSVRKDKLNWSIKVIDSMMDTTKPFQLEYRVLEKNGHGWLKLITPPSWVDTDTLKECVKLAMVKVMSA